MVLKASEEVQSIGPSVGGVAPTTVPPDNFADDYLKSASMVTPETSLSRQESGSSTATASTPTLSDDTDLIGIMKKPQPLENKVYSHLKREVQSTSSCPNLGKHNHLQLTKLKDEFWTKSRKKSSMENEAAFQLSWSTDFQELKDNLEKYANDNDSFTSEDFISVFRKQYILSYLYRLFDWEREQRLKQCAFVDKLKLSTQGEVGAREWTELVEVIAYVVCGEDGDVTEDLFSRILTSHTVLEKLFKLINKDGDGKVTRQEIMDFIANLTHARPRTGFTRENLDWLERMFRQALGHKQELTFEDFKKIVNSRNSFFAERVFNIFDRDQSGSVSLSEFLDAMHQFAGKSPDDKIKFLFRVYDLDGDGLIQRSELQKVMKACMEENGMKFSDEQIEDLTLALFEDADTAQQGTITYDALKAQLLKHPGLLENLSISIDRWLVPPEPTGKDRNLVQKVSQLRPYQLSLPYLKNNYVYLIFLAMYITVNLCLFISRAYEFREKNGLYIIARATGQCLNFNCMFVVVLMLRQCITFLRAHGAAYFLPLDQHIYLHKLCGWVIFLLSFTHTLMHLINFSCCFPSEFSYFQLLLTSEPGLFGLISGWANPTGVILIIILTVMVICSLPFVRMSGYFEVFYWTHLLYIIFFALTILHAPRFWMWFLGPGVVFLIERIHRTIRMRTGHGKTYISSGVLLPSKVIHLVIQKPGHFHFHPGDYVFINIPAIAKYEWHPFTISSAPEQNDALWLHIRAVGQWTTKLNDYFEKQHQSCQVQGTGKSAPGSAAFSTQGEVIIAVEDDIRIQSSQQMRQLRAEESLTEDDQNQLQRRKNGITNLAYEPSSEDLADEPKDDRESLDKSQVDRSKSVPSFTGRIMEEKKLLDNWRSLPRVDGDDVAAPVESLHHIGRSFRYMRNKPKIYTLDTPEDMDVDQKGTTGSIKLADNDLDEVNLSKNRQTVVSFNEGDSVIQPRRSNMTDMKETRRKSRRVSRLEQAESLGQCVIPKPLVIYIDGPYGAPSSHIFRAQHAVLVATGIGVTPFASILQSIMHKYWKARHICPRCTHEWTSELPQSVMNLKKVDFFWINRHQRSFEWFVNLLSQLEIEQAEHGGVMDRFLDMHMYITSALQKTDMKAVGLQLALDLLHEKEKRDLITGLKTRTNAGRPNWDKVFKQLSNQNKGKITVFYCGPPALGRTLRYKCDEYGFDFRKEIF